MSNPDKNHEDELVRKNARMGLAVLGVVVLMLGLSFAAVPFYSLFCRVTGFGGTTQVSTELPDRILDRTVSIKFNADTSPHMGWDFRPELRQIDVRLGERGLASYMAHNRSDKATTGSALYNVTPDKAGKYFHKIQCFCFSEQTLGPHETVSMPVLFFVDPSMNDDPNMEDVTTITLSYTFFPADSKELEDGVEAFYNSGDTPPSAATN